MGNEINDVEDTIYISNSFADRTEALEYSCRSEAMCDILLLK